MRDDVQIHVPVLAPNESLGTSSRYFDDDGGEREEKRRRERKSEVFGIPIMERANDRRSRESLH